MTARRGLGADANPADVAAAEHAAATEVDKLTVVIAALLNRHYYAGGWAWRSNWEGGDIPGRWSCGCGAYGTPERTWGALVAAHRRHVAGVIAEFLEERVL